MSSHTPGNRDRGQRLSAGVSVAPISGCWSRQKEGHTAARRTDDAVSMKTDVCSQCVLLCVSTAGLHPHSYHSLSLCWAVAHLIMRLLIVFMESLTP